MASFHVETSGLAESRAALKVKVRAVNAATRTATRQAKNHLDREVKNTLRRRSHRRGTPTPSPAGEPPAKISGNLARTVRSRGPRMLRRGVWEAEIGPTAVYSRIQELGGHTGRGHRTHLPPRPYMKPTTRAQLARLHEFYRRAWREAIAA